MVRYMVGCCVGPKRPLSMPIGATLTRLEGTTSKQGIPIVRTVPYQVLTTSLLYSLPYLVVAYGTY